MQEGDCNPAKKTHEPHKDWPVGFGLGRVVLAGETEMMSELARGSDWRMGAGKRFSHFSGLEVTPVGAGVLLKLSIEGVAGHVQFAVVHFLFKQVIKLATAHVRAGFGVKAVRSRGERRVDEGDYKLSNPAREVETTRPLVFLA